MVFFFLEGQFANVHWTFNPSTFLLSSLSLFYPPVLLFPLHHYNRDPQPSYPGSSFLSKNIITEIHWSLSPYTHRQEYGRHVTGSTITLSEHLQILLGTVSGSFSGIISPLFTYSTLPAPKTHENKSLLKEFSLSSQLLIHYREAQSLTQSEWRWRRRAQDCGELGLCKSFLPSSPARRTSALLEPGLLSVEAWSGRRVQPGAPAAARV